MTPKTDSFSRRPTAAKVAYRTVKVDGLDIFYREAGPQDAPALLLLHGFPTSSHMFRNLIPALADEFHLIAPDYPGFGDSSMPTVDQFEYTFDHLAAVIEKFTEQVGLRSTRCTFRTMARPSATAWPSSIRSGCRPSWCRTATPTMRASTTISGNLSRLTGKRRQQSARPRYAPFSPGKPPSGNTPRASGTRRRSVPITGTSINRWLDRPGNAEIQLALFYSYGSNPPLYPKWQAYFRQHQPPTLIVWGKNDPIFPRPALNLTSGI